MKIETTKKFDRDYLKLSEELKQQVDKKLQLFLENSKHPSLRMKKIQGCDNLWEVSITMKYRFVFWLDGDVCILYRIGPHDILGNL